jgi:hypothetical protein
VLREFQFNLTVEQASGRATAYLLEMMEGGQWQWIADAEFGPFETTLDVSNWLVRRLVDRKALHLR